MFNLPEATNRWTNTYAPIPTAIPPRHLRPFIIASILSKTLIEAFKAHYYFGASLASPVQAAISLTKYLRPERDLETRRLISEKDAGILPRAEQALIEEMVMSAKQDFGSAIPADLWTEGMNHLLGKIFSEVVKLYQILHRQNARYFVDMAPARDWTFSPAQMEDMLDPGEGSETVKGQAIEVSVFPAVYKKRDDWGENLLVTTVVCKARVVVKKK